MTPDLVVAGIFFALVACAIVGAGYLFLEQADDQHTAQETTANRLLRRLAESGLWPEVRTASTQKKLFQAGFRSPEALGLYRLVQVLLAVTLFAAFLHFSWTGALAAVGFALLLPGRILETQLARRMAKLRAALPAAIDLLVLALEVGNSLDSALRQTATVLRPLYPELSMELQLCSIEMQAATSRIDALKRLSERCPEEELRKVVTVICDAERFGSSLGAALRTHAHYLRIRMRQSVQEYARKLSVRLVLPVFLLIFPSVLLVTLGPAYLQLQRFLDGLI